MKSRAKAFYFFALTLSVAVLSMHSAVATVHATSRNMTPVYHLLISSTSDTPQQWGRWPSPETTFTLPAKDDGEGYYYPDLQASFPSVDWSKLERLYIPAGSYRFIHLGNLPLRARDNPLVITNKGGQVHVGGFDHYYLFLLKGGKNWVLTGRYDPLSKTGDAGFPGHWGGAYAHSRDTYGFLIDDDYVREGNSGMAIGGRASDFEVEYVEIREVGFAGMTVKTDDDASAVMENVSIHDTYIHDTLSEGFYIGSTQNPPQHQIRNLQLYNNRVIRSGTEAIQLGQLGGNVHIRNNVFALSAIHWKDAFQPWQDGNLQIGVRAGDVTVENNIFIGAAGNMAFVSAQLREGDEHPEKSTLLFKNNYFSSSRNLFFYLRNDEIPALRYQFRKNFFTHWDFQRREIDSSAAVPLEMIRSFTPAPVEFTDNTWNADLNFCNQLKSGNGAAGSHTGSGNARKPPPALRFMDNGLTDDFDYLKVEVWAATAGRGGNAPIRYEEDDIAVYQGVPYRCRMSACDAGLSPPQHPSAWQRLPYFADDWRLRPSTELENLGLLY